MTYKRILIVCELYYPLNTIGAIRPSKLARYLQAEGYRVDVFTATELSRPEYHADAGYRIVSCFGVDTAEAPEKKPQRNSKIAVHKRGKLLTELAMTRRQWVQYCKSGVFLQQFRHAVASGNIDLANYDCIFTTFGPVGSVLIGLEAKRMRPELRWICDFRDPMVSKIMPKCFVPFYGYLQRKSIRLADCVTTVSYGYKKRIMPRNGLDKCLVIPNGYDPDDEKLLAQAQRDSKFSFAYVGSLYEGKRDLSLLFRAIREMIDSGKMDAEKIRFHYAGDEIAFLRQQAQPYDLEAIIDDHGRMTHEACMALQASVRFLVMSTWNEKGEEGVFPGKLIEYMLMKKPVINITNGELPNCEVTQVIRELELGVSCEEADSESYTALTRWLEAQCSAFHAGQAAIFQPKTEEIEARYNWKNIIKRFGELIDG